MGTNSGGTTQRGLAPLHDLNRGGESLSPAGSCETYINGLPGSGVMVECLVDRIWKHGSHVCKLLEREFTDP